MTDTQRYARVPATMGREGWHRDAPHTATLGALTGRGTSQAGALADLGSLIIAACQRGASVPVDGVTFAYDADNANLWIAVPDVLHGGASEYVVDCSGDVPANPHGGGSRTGMARDAFATAVGMAPLPDRAAPKPLPQMPAEVREMLSTAADALTALGRFGDNLTECELAARASLADLADYVSGQYAPSQPDRCGCGAPASPCQVGVCMSAHCAGHPHSA